MDDFFTTYSDIKHMKQAFVEDDIDDDEFYDLEGQTLQSIIESFIETDKNKFLSSYYFEKNIHVDRKKNSSPTTYPLPTDNAIILDDELPPNDVNEETTSTIENIPIPTRVIETEKFVENEIFLLIKSRREGDYIFKSYLNTNKVKFTKINNIVIYEYIYKDPVNFIIKTETFKWLSEQLEQIFPTAKKNVWYIPYAASTTDSLEVSESGKLYWYYKDLRKAFTNVGIIEKSDSSADKIKNPPAVLDCISLFKNFEGCLIDENRENYDDDNVMKGWEASFKSRQNILKIKSKKSKKDPFKIPSQIYVRELKCLGDEISISLLITDGNKIFEQLRSQLKQPNIGLSNNLKSEWSTIALKLIKIVQDSKAEGVNSFKEKYQEILESGNCDDDLLALFALPYYLSVKINNCTKKQSAEAFFLVVKDEKEIEAARKDHEDSLKKLSININLYVILCGDPLAITKSYVCFNGILKHYSNPFKAIEVSTKFLDLLNHLTQIIIAEFAKLPVPKLANYWFKMIRKCGLENNMIKTQ
uniref:Uncharacterized protein n=1 Tax=Trichogramma kaykai TaxID=54128 RepID=A0ABD2WJK6_9HYME